MALFVKKDHEESEIDVGSFADIAFLLIIFFILTTTFEKPMGNRMDIPTGQENPDSNSEEKTPTINIVAEGIRWGEDQESITIEQLRTRLLELNFPDKESDARTIIVDCAPEVKYDLYFEIMMAVTEAGGVAALMDYEESGSGASGGGSGGDGGGE